MSEENAIREIYRVTIWGTIVNFVLSILKIIAGLIGGSAAVFTDGLHSLSDLATDFAVLLGTKFSEKKPDERHPYGHRWYETLSTLFISFALLAVGSFSINRAISSEDAGHVFIPTWPMYIVTIFSILSKECLYQVTAKSARKTSSSSLLANAWHHRSDALSSIAVLGGLFLVNIGVKAGDGIAAGIVGFMIIIAAFKLLAGVFSEFSNSAVNRETLNIVTLIADKEPQIGQIHRLRSRNVGREIFLDFHMLVNPDMTVTEAHAITERLENSIRDNLNVPVNITTHIEPDTPKTRKSKD